MKDPREKLADDIAAALQMLICMVAVGAAIFGVVSVLFVVDSIVRG